MARRQRRPHTVPTVRTRAVDRDTGCGGRRRRTNRSHPSEGPEGDTEAHQGLAPTAASACSAAYRHPEARRPARRHRQNTCPEHIRISDPIPPGNRVGKKVADPRELGAAVSKLYKTGSKKSAQNRGSEGNQPDRRSQWHRPPVQDSHRPEKTATPGGLQTPRRQIRGRPAHPGERHSEVAVICSGSARID